MINQGSLFYHALPPPHVMNLRIPPTLTGCHHQSLRSGRHTLFRTSGAHCVLCLPTFRFPDRALYSEIAPGAGVGVCGFSSDVLMRGSQAGDLNLALTARQCGREEGSYTPHSRRHWLVEQSRWGLAPPHSLLPPSRTHAALTAACWEVSSKWLRFPAISGEGKGIFPKVPIIAVTGEVKVGGLKVRSCLGATE